MRSSSVNSIDSTAHRMSMLRVLSNSIDSTDKVTDKEVAEYRRELSALLDIPPYDYIGDYYEIKDAIDLL